MTAAAPAPAAEVQRRASVDARSSAELEAYLKNPPEDLRARINEGKRLIKLPADFPSLKNQVKIILSEVLLRTLDGTDRGHKLAQETFNATLNDPNQLATHDKAAILLASSYHLKRDYPAALQLLRDISRLTIAEHLKDAEWHSKFYLEYAKCAEFNEGDRHKDWQDICDNYVLAISYLEKMQKPDNVQLYHPRLGAIRAAINCNRWMTAAEHLEKIKLNDSEDAKRIYNQMKWSRIPIEILHRGLQFHHLPRRDKALIGAGVATVALTAIAKRYFG